MPLKQLSYRRFDDDEAFYVENHADYVGDELDTHPAIRELQQASKSGILNAIRQPQNTVIKVQSCTARPAEKRGKRLRNIGALPTRLSPPMPHMILATTNPYRLYVPC
jgi:hypothetical protein